MLLTRLLLLVICSHAWNQLGPSWPVPLKFQMIQLHANAFCSFSFFETPLNPDIQAHSALFSDMTNNMTPTEVVTQSLLALDGCKQHFLVLTIRLEILSQNHPFSYLKLPGPLRTATRTPHRNLVFHRAPPLVTGTFLYPSSCTRSMLWEGWTVQHSPKATRPWWLNL